MKEFRKRWWLEVALCTSLLSYCTVLQAAASDGDDDFLAARSPLKNVAALTSDSYTINFNNISMLEFLRFASKLTNLNFIFEEPDVQFPVSFISEEPISAKNVMAALAQVLRIHDLILLEQDGNVIITKSTKVHQVTPIIASEQPEEPPANALLVTRVFRIKNASLGTLQTIIRPMVSDSALIEVSNETKQLIITDIATNVEQIANLLLSLDSPHSPLDVEAYTVKIVPTDELIALTQQILAPFTEGNTLLFVPQKENNTIYVVSTPHLIERALIVMEDLDVAPKAHIVVPPSARKNIFVYNVQNRPLSDIVDELNDIIKQMKVQNIQQPALRSAILGVEIVKETNALIFFADDATVAQLKDLLSSLDTSTTVKGEIKSTFLIYTPKYRNGEDLYTNLQDTARQLKESGLVNSAFLQTLSSMRWNAATNSLLFTGDPQSLERIQVLLTNMDTPTAYVSKTTEVLIYKPKFASPQQITKALEGLVPSLKSTNTYADQTLIKAIKAFEWNPDTQSFAVTTDPATVARLKTLLDAFDSTQQGTSPLSQGFFLYKLQNAQGDRIIEELKVIAAKIPPTNLQNQNLIQAINSLEWVRTNNSLIITGSAEAIEEVKAMLVDFDVPAGVAPPSGAPAFFIYKPVSLPGEELLTVLQDLSKDMQASGLNDPALFKTISSARYVSATNSLLFAGSQETLDKIKSLLSSVEVSAGSIQQIGNLTFLLYKLQTSDPDQFMASLKSFAQELQKSNVGDQEVAEAINNMKYIKENNSILFTGSQQALQRIESIAGKFDVPGTKPTVAAPTVARGVSSFVIYSPKYISGEELISILCDFMNNLVSAGVSNPSLFDTINNLKWIPKTSSLLVSGEQSSIDQVQALLQQFDIPSGTSSSPSIENIDNTSFLVYKLQFHSGVDIQTSLQKIAANLAKGLTPNTILSDAIESIQWIEPTNSLIATGPQDVLVKLKELIQNIDIPLRQVFIEILVIQTALTNIQNFGLQWGSQIKYFNKTVLQTANLPAPGSTQGSSGLPFLSNALQPINNLSQLGSSTIPFSTGFDLGVIGDIIMHNGQSFISLGSLLNAIQLDNDATIVTNQKIITQDNRQSTIFVGSNVPYTGSLVTNITANTTSTANIEYRDVGVNLTITPILGENDIITLDIVQDLSAVVGGTQSLSTATLTGITTTHSHMETRATMPDGKFLVLSGVIQDSKQHYRSGIPCLGSLPVVGALFSENDRTNGKQNIIIFVRPKIINSFDEYKQITEHQEWLYKDQARLPVLKEEFDEGIDIVKTPEDE